jgi:hypothetical protein
MIQTFVLSLSLFNPVTTHAQEYQNLHVAVILLSQNEGNTAANLNPRVRFYSFV